MVLRPLSLLTRYTLQLAAPRGEAEMWIQLRCSEMRFHLIPKDCRNRRLDIGENQNSYQLLSKGISVCLQIWEGDSMKHTHKYVLFVIILLVSLTWAQADIQVGASFDSQLTDVITTVNPQAPEAEDSNNGVVRANTEKSFRNFRGGHG